MWDIFTSLTQYSRWDCSETDVKHTSATVGPISRELYFLYSCIAAIVLLVFVVLRVLSAQLWLAEGPERVKQQRDQTRTETRGEKKKKKRVQEEERRKHRKNIIKEYVSGTCWSIYRLREENEHITCPLVLHIDTNIHSFATSNIK